MHKIQSSTSNYVFSEEVNDHYPRLTRKRSVIQNIIGTTSTPHTTPITGRFSRRNTKWCLIAERIHTGEFMKRHKLRPQRQSVGSIALRMMTTRRSDPKLLDQEIKKLHKLQEQRQRKESRALEEEREIARKIRNREILEGMRSLPESGSSRKITLVDKQGNKFTPIERFQKIVRLLCFLLKIKFRIERKYKQPQHSVVFEQLEELTESGISSDDGMVFDPKYFKAIREVKLNPDAVQILSMCPGTRTEEQIQAALVGLKAAVAAFGEYPLKMQRTLVNVGWYESFEAKRVIIRQGHRAENFYFILSGTALVTLLVNDPATGEERSTTIAVLEKGSSFGELALLHHKARSATVLCKNEVALLAVGREDFRNIFMSYEDGKEPDHVQFLRTIPYLKHLPLDQCVTRHDVCIFHYFRRGVVILKNSNTEWIYVLKSGSCRVLTNLAKRRNSTSSLRGNETILNLPVIPVNEFERRRLLYTASGERTSRVAWSPENKRPRTEPEPRKGKSDLSLPAITGDNEKFKKTVKKVNFALPWLEKFNPKDAQEQVNAHRQRIVSLYREMTDAALLNNKDTNLKKDNKNSEKLEHVCVQIELIKPKDQFGLASILYDNDAVKCHLVSNGAECILIKKSWFLQNTSEAMMRELRAQIPPYPTQETLEQNLQDQANWESFKSQTISDLLDTLHL